MNDDPDVRYDIDALFKQFSNNIDFDPDDEQDWCFSLRSADFPTLE